MADHSSMSLVITHIQLLSIKQNDNIYLWPNQVQIVDIGIGKIHQENFGDIR